MLAGCKNKEIDHLLQSLMKKLQKFSQCINCKYMEKCYEDLVIHLSTHADKNIVSLSDLSMQVLITTNDQ